MRKLKKILKGYFSPRRTVKISNDGERVMLYIYIFFSILILFILISVLIKNSQVPPSMFMQ